jgi:hypothetical protein
MGCAIRSRRAESASNLALWGMTEMLSRDSIAGSGEMPIRVGKTRDREWSPKAVATNPAREARLFDEWFDGNRQAITANTFFPPAVEPGAPIRDH